ncbi:MAG: hypothetical protein WA957_00865 [Alteraurantiacibacter sp.]
MSIRYLIALAALLLPSPLLADDTEATLEGNWALRIDDATIFVFDLDQQDDGAWAGSWTRPYTIASNGVVFREMDGEQTVLPLETVQRRDAVQMTFKGTQEAGLRDILQFRLTGENQAQLTYRGIAGNPYPLIRVPSGTVLGPFDPLRIYDRDDAITMAEYQPDAEPVAPLDMADAGDIEVENNTMADDDSEQRPRIEADFLDGL